MRARACCLCTWFRWLAICCNTKDQRPSIDIPPPFTTTRLIDHSSNSSSSFTIPISLLDFFSNQFKSHKLCRKYEFIKFTQGKLDSLYTEYLFFLFAAFLKRSFCSTAFIFWSRKSQIQNCSNHLKIHAFTKTYPSSYSSAPAD